MIAAAPAGLVIGAGLLLLAVLAIALYRAVNRRRNWSDDDITEAKLRYEVAQRNKNGMDGF